ncbi:hypothetical protein [Acinetobacter nosocomialis]|uniref:hypothetical protein n=1 Tax=Acinetobacter nosocomialis TaxID=106654 RepID=UPI0023AEAFCD|nr:hypothetical protein [Acinetobacter nosocomialis]MDE9408458.1 hypothetical protein [Acinetobacter nosocomialis]
MPIFTLNNNELNAVETTSFKEEAILERLHLQKALKKNIGVIAEDCLIIAEEYAEWDGSKRRIDLLAIDKNANLVIIELKRTDTGDHMELQALRYASMVSTMTLDIAIDIYRRYKINNGYPSFDHDNARKEISNFVDVDNLDESNFADDVRIILVSSNFSKELTTSVIWLNERDLDITCIRMQPYTHNSQILVDIQQIIPLPEAKDYQIKAQKKSEERREAKLTNARDYSSFIFNGKTLNKRYLALEIIKCRFDEIDNKNIEDLRAEFNEYPNLDRLLVKINQLDEQRYDRYFIEKEHHLQMSNGDIYVVSNQWGKGNIYQLIEIAANFNYEIINTSKDQLKR